MRFLLLAAAAVGVCAVGTPAAHAQSYKINCTQVTERGDYIEATCLNRRMQLVRSSINPSQCGGRDIANIDGRLACGGGGGPPPYAGDGYRRPPPPYGGEYGDRRFGPGDDRYGDRGPPPPPPGFGYRRPPPPDYDDGDGDRDYRPRRPY